MPRPFATAVLRFRSPVSPAPTVLKGISHRAGLHKARLAQLPSTCQKRSILSMKWSLVIVYETVDGRQLCPGGGSETVCRLKLNRDQNRGRDTPALER